MKKMKSILIIVVSFIVILFFSEACNKDTDQYDESDLNPNLIGVDGGTITNLDGASITIPPGALSNSTEITIETFDNQINSNEYTAALGNFAGGVVLGPDDLSFQKPVTITIPLNTSLGPDVSEVILFYKDNGDPSNSHYPPNYSGWKQTNYVGKVNADRQSVTAQIDHFSEYVVQLTFGGSTLDVIGEAATTLGDNGLGVDLESYTEYFESHVAGIGDVHSYNLPMDGNYNNDPDSYGYDDYKVVGIRYELYHDFGSIFENPLIIFHGRKYENSFSFFYNYEGDRVLTDRQFIYHLFINVYYVKTSALDVIEIDVPTVTTSFLTDDEDKVAYAGGEVTHAGEISDNWIELVTERGIFLNGSKIKLGQGVGSFVMELQDLEPQKHYILRAYVINSAGNGYGEEVRFVLDIDENIYRTVIIGDQEWFAKNLKTTKLNEGTPIPYTDDKYLWEDAYYDQTPAYTWYDNDINNKYIYGALYNWYTVDTDKLCPIGWHVPSFDEYLELVEYAGGIDVAGGKLKAAGTTHWKSPNTGATNEFGLTALPGGGYFHQDLVNHQYDFGFGRLGRSGYWWTTDSGSGESYGYSVFVELNYNKESAESHSYWGGTGFSVLCVKD
jgi:uncharacterized protein (TIGR02145 family)